MPHAHFVCCVGPCSSEKQFRLRIASVRISVRDWNWALLATA